MINVVLLVTTADNTLPYTFSESDIVEIEQSLMTKSFSHKFFEVKSETYARDIPAVYWVYLEKSSGIFTKVDNWRFGNWMISPDDCIITYKTEIEGRHVVIGEGSSGVLRRSIIYSGVSLSFDKFWIIFMVSCVAAICFICLCSKYNKRKRFRSKLYSYDDENGDIFTRHSQDEGAPAQNQSITTGEANQ